MLGTFMRRVKTFRVGEQWRGKGHSKWQNIRHIKAANDEIKSKMRLRHCANIRVALSGGADPTSNSNLAKALKAALLDGVPRSTAESVVKNFKSPEGKEEDFLIRGPGNSRLVVTGIIPSRATFLCKVAPLLKKTGSSLENSSSIKSFFLKKSVFLLKGPSSLEEAENAAIEADAEEVNSVDDAYELISDPQSLFRVKEKLLALTFSDGPATVISSDIVFFPHFTVSLSPDERIHMNKLSDQLSMQTDILSVYDNSE